MSLRALYWSTLQQVADTVILWEGQHLSADVAIQRVRATLRGVKVTRPTLPDGWRILHGGRI